MVLPLKTTSPHKVPCDRETEVWGLEAGNNDLNGLNCPLFIFFGKCLRAKKCEKFGHFVSHSRLNSKFRSWDGRRECDSIMSRIPDSLSQVGSTDEIHERVAFPTRNDPPDEAVVGVPLGGRVR